MAARPARQKSGAATSILRSALVTALVFASAAFLATLLVSERFEARSLVVVGAAGEGQAPEPMLLALAGAPAFADRLDIRLNEEGGDAADARLPDRVLRALDGARFAETPRGAGFAAQQSVVVERGGGAGEIVVNAVAATPDGARELSDAMAGEIAEWMRGQAPERPAANLPSLEVDEARVRALRESLRSLAESPSSVAAQERRALLADAADELDRALREVRARIAVLSGLARDPAAAQTLEGLDDDRLSSRIEAYRTLQRATIGLELTLPQDNPRRLIARSRLAAIGDEIAELAAAAEAQAGTEGDAIELRLRNARAAIAGLDEEIGALSERRREQERLQERLREAEAGLAQARELRLEVAEDGAATVIRTEAAGEPSEISPSPLIVTSLAGLAGLFFGTLAGGASAAARRWRVGRDEESLDDEGPADESVVPENAPLLGERVPEEDRPAAERTSLPELAAALGVSPVSRLLVASDVERGGEPDSLRLARRLAGGGSLVLLVDVSPAQRAARAVGLPEDVAGFADVVAGSLGLSSVTVGDDEGTADLVAGGRGGMTLSGTKEAATILERVRGAYDHMVVDCGTLAAPIVAGLADRDCAVVLSSAGPATERSRRLRELEAAGIGSVLLIGDR